MRSASGTGQRAPVCLLGVPVELFLRSQQHTDDLVRELWLMSLAEPDGRYRVMLDTAEAYASTGLDIRNTMLTSVLAARAAGQATADLECVVPVGTAETTAAWAALLDQLDDLCRSGSLLTLASSSELVLFRRWYVGETIRQLREGARPTPYAQWRDHGWVLTQPTGA